MNILWISEFPPDNGGVGDYSRHIVEGLAERGHEVDILTSSCENPSDLAENVKHIGKAPENEGLEWRKYLGDKYDIVCLQYPGIRSVGFTKFRLLGRISSPAVLVTHESLSRPQLYPLISLFRDFGFLTSHPKEDFQNFYQILNFFRREKTFDLPYHGVEQDLEDKLDRKDLKTNLDEDKTSIVCPGFIVERKNYHKVAECFDKVLEEHPDAELVFAGGSHRNEGDEYQKKIEKLIEEKGLEEHTQITGVLDSEDHVYEYIRQADVVVLPYHEINQSGILARSLPIGTPTVVSDIPGLREPVQKYGGRIADSTSREDLSRAIIEEIDNPTKIDSDQAKEDMSWEKNIEEYEKMFEQIIEQRS